jgi:hypothetical protein
LIIIIIFFNLKETNKKNDRYDGSYKNGMRNGKGTMVYDNGDKYVGQWKDDKRNGTGTFYFHSDPNRGDKYDGQWKNDRICGKGIYIWSNGSKYDGDWSCTGLISLKHGQMVTNMWVVGRMIKEMAMVFFITTVYEDLKVNGKMIEKKALALNTCRIMIFTKAILKIIHLMATAFIIINLRLIDTMKVDGKT